MGEGLTLDQWLSKVDPKVLTTSGLQAASCPEVLSILIVPFYFSIAHFTPPIMLSLLCASTIYPCRDDAYAGL